MSSTILDLKKAFLQNQIRNLSNPFSLAPRWRETAPLTREHDALPEKTVQDAMHKANVLLRQHSRTVYNAQTVRAVAEQIDHLYWDVGEPEEGEADKVEEGVLIIQDLDLSYHGDIAKLPEEWPEGEEEEDMDTGAERDKYAQLRSQLSTLSEKEQELRRKTTIYKQLLQMLLPIKDPKNNIQPNLVTKDGELGKELEKMKVLMVRLGEKVKSSDIGGQERDKERFQ
ncbi:MAG: hypothetical protein MMC33_000793 [Icmadophila ericetorum]|nr:hypothetical protein [Icmadophila ericetorum]